MKTLSSFFISFQVILAIDSESMPECLSILVGGDTPVLIVF